jgi:DNA-binding transcriptional LysR family regulator
MVFDGRLLSGIGVMIAAIENGSFVRAGDALGLTASGVSRAIARLEARLGVRLFDRNPRRLVLTDEGQNFYDEVAPYFAAIADAAEDVGETTAAVRGRLRINVDPWFARIVLAPRLPELTARHPLLSLDLIVSNHREQMMAGGVDLALRFGPPDDSALIARKLLETRVLTCAAPAYLAQHGIPQVPEDVAGHQALLFRDPQSGRPFTWEFHRSGQIVQVPVQGRVVTDDPSVALAACVAGQGLFQSLALGLDRWLAEGRLVQVLADWSDERFALHAYYPSRRHVPAKVRAFLNFVSEGLIAESPEGDGKEPVLLRCGGGPRP